MSDLDFKLNIRRLVDEMFRLQIMFNNETNGEEWVNGVTKEGACIDWTVCITQESAELIDSIPWKHWKDLSSKVDYDNILIELVDIWHFVMSRVMEINKKGCSIELPLFVDRLVIVTSNTITEVRDTTAIPYSDDSKYIRKFMIDHVKKLIYVTLNEDASSEELIYTYFKLLYVVNSYAVNLNLPVIGIEELYKLYIGKNGLNRVRQLNGYKSGEYNKLWVNDDGSLVEDNVIMKNMINNNSINPLTFNNVVDELDNYYKKHFTKHDK